jgi:ABC-type amino acid transport substrate-binding protein
MADFVANLPAINALAEHSPGFIWRLQSESGNATSIKVYEDDMIIVNLTVWETPDALRAFVYKSDHYGFLRERKRWFEKFSAPYYAIWWVPAGHIPTTEEAKERLEYLREHGDTSYSFSFKNLFPEPLETA